MAHLRRRPIALLVVLVAALGLAPFGTHAQSPAQLPFRNADLPVEKRIDDLLGRLTLDEKLSLMIERAAPVERLGIPKFPWWNEALHGVARTGRATVSLDERALSLIGKDGRRVVEPGRFEGAVGGKQPGLSGTADAATTMVLTAGLELVGPAKPIAP